LTRSSARVGSMTRYLDGFQPAGAIGTVCRCLQQPSGSSLTVDVTRISTSPRHPEHTFSELSKRPCGRRCLCSTEQKAHAQAFGPSHSNLKCSQSCANATFASRLIWQFVTNLPSVFLLESRSCTFDLDSPKVRKNS